jgi:glycosyltransferase involved in cell wall biosynthesis
MSVELVVIIPTSGQSLELLARTLASLDACDRPEGYRGTIVVENGSHSYAKHVVDEYKGCLSAEYIFMPRPGKNVALNEALSHVPDRTLALFADDDIRLDRYVLRSYTEAAEDRSVRMFFGGPTSVDYEVEPPSWLVTFLPLSARGWQWSGPNLNVDRPEFLGFNWAAFVEDIRAVGGFNPALGPGTNTLTTVGDETEMQQRLLTHQIKGRYVPGAKVWHYVPVARSSPEWVLDRAFRSGISKGLHWPEGLRLFGLPPIAYWWLAKAHVRRVLALFANERFRFKATYCDRLNRGLLEGFQKAKA